VPTVGVAIPQAVASTASKSHASPGFPLTWPSFHLPLSPNSKFKENKEKIMMKRMLSAVSVCLALLLLTSMMAMAADRDNLILNGREVIVKHPLTRITPAAPRDPSLKTIAGNLSDYPYGVFFCCFGYYITGLHNLLNVVPEYWQAVPFTPSTDMKVNEVDASVGWNEGTNAVVLSLNRDSGGLPGKPIHTWTAKNLERYGSCCQLVTGKSKRGLAVKKGVQYWIAVSTNSSDENIFASWALNSTDMRPFPLATYCDDSGQGSCNGTSGKWTPANALLPGFAVLGH
jgi:hypothetical protein